MLKSAGGGPSDHGSGEELGEYWPRSVKKPLGKAQKGNNLKKLGKSQRNQAKSGKVWRVKRVRK
ncbi:hypothetical protein F2Q69_00062109 [Brassica cretica]|uniref:Uncharacterized protein n=1 Tax=Brassica cretica TaxID=69181 RepID=A0A8S9RDP1_BRACR|nr:hypothetical protein F2Q69_00062109 [Brassica cretica]